MTVESILDNECEREDKIRGAYSGALFDALSNIANKDNNPNDPQTVLLLNGDTTDEDVNEFIESIRSNKQPFIVVDNTGPYLRVVLYGYVTNLSDIAHYNAENLPNSVLMSLAFDVFSNGKANFAVGPDGQYGLDGISQYKTSLLQANANGTMPSVMAHEILQICGAVYYRYKKSR